MPLTDRPDFKAWLAEFEAAYPDLRPIAGEPLSSQLYCNGCGDALNDLDSRCGQCLVCLAEEYGRDQAEAAAAIARILAVALVTDTRTPPHVIRVAVEDVLDEHEQVFAARSVVAADPS